MKDAYAEFQALNRSWQEARKSRPGETDFSPYGLKDGRAEDFDALFNDWEGALATAASKTKTASAGEKAIEAIIRHFILQLNNVISPVTRNGFQWLIQSAAFPQKVAELGAALNPLLDARFRARKAVIDALRSDVNQSLVNVEKAAPLADALVEQQATIVRQSEEITEALTQSKASEQEAATAQEAAAKHLEAIKQVVEDAAASKVEYDETISGVKEALEAAESVLGTIKQDRSAADAQVVESNKQLKEATKKITVAISDLNRQGLAGAFDKSAKKLGWERIGWLGAFVVAIGYLVCVILKLHSKNDPQTALWERMLHVLPLLAPGIWLGWFAAKNASLTARIQQDYTYKVATAQSFEAYKKEVEATGDKALEKQLLETTIRNFGDNPIRIYDGKGAEGHPLEALKSVLDDKQFERLLALLKSVKPSGGS